MQAVQAKTANASATPSAQMSPAAKQLAALNEQDGKPRRKPSRLRRALSFGSAVDFRRMAGGSGGDAGDDNVRPRTAGDEIMDAADAEEQERIAQRQEERGIGSSIYGKRFFAASTDNLSVSSTASSASVMIRKMGSGMKRTSRSLAGLFRPKASRGASVESGMPGSMAAVSMVNAEADSIRLGGGGGGGGGGSSGGLYLDGATLAEYSAPTPSLIASSDRTDSGVTDASRKSIFGGDGERAEILAAVRKGILKSEWNLF